MQLLPSESLPDDHRSGFVVILGKPNVGKSTLMNYYLGQKVAIVSSKPQTTRRHARGILTLPHAQIVFVDTPGIHQPRNGLGEYMVETAVRALRDVDVALFMVDVSQPANEEDRRVAQLLIERKPASVIMVLNKMDLLPPEKAAPLRDAYLSLLNCRDWITTSAARGDNCPRLLELIIEHLPPGPRYYPPDQITDLDLRFVAAELVREQALSFLHQEIPHSVAVVIEEFKERREDLTYISAIIYVEKESQKGIVLGQGGSMLKQIGRAARKEIESLLGHKVYLELWVKVRPKWRKDEQALRYLGYTLPKEKH